MRSLPEEPEFSLEDFVRDDIIHGQGVPPVKLLLTLPEASHVLAISRSKLYDLLNSGHLPSVHIGRSRRVRVRDIEKFINGGGHEY